MFGSGRFIKEGRGVERDTGKKSSFTLFFEILGRKFLRLIPFNVIYFIFVLPLLVLLIVYTVNIFNFTDEIIASTPIFKYSLKLAILIPQPVSLILLGISAVCFGPITAGLIYTVRNFSREEHAWFSDIFDHAKNNFKQAFVLGIIDIIVFSSFILYTRLDLSSLEGSTRLFYGIFKYTSYVCVTLYTFMRFYSYIILVTFDMKVSEILKNSLIFAFLGLGRNILTIICLCFMILFMFLLILMAPVFDVILLILIAFSFASFIQTYITYPVIKKYMLQDAITPSSPSTGD